MEEEFNALGLAEQFPIRGRITDEWMKICIEAWTSDGPATFEGEHRQFERVGGMVGCVQEPHIPIWVGGKGPIAARRVARYATGYHTISSTPEEVAAEIKIVNDEVERQGRDPAEIEVSMLGPMVLLDGDPDSVRGFPGGRRRQRGSDRRDAGPIRGGRSAPCADAAHIQHARLGHHPGAASRSDAAARRGGHPRAAVGTL